MAATTTPTKKKSGNTTTTTKKSETIFSRGKSFGGGGDAKTEPLLHVNEDNDNNNEEPTEEQLMSAIKDWNNAKPVVIVNTISSLCMILLAQLMAFLSIPIGVIGLIACSVYASDLFRLKKGLGATVKTVKMLALVCVILDASFAAVSLAIGSFYAGGEMVTTMVLMSSLFAAHGFGYWEMYKRAKEIGKILN